MRRNNVYQGAFTATGWYQVTLNGSPFDPAPSQSLYNHSPCGFAWGYRGSGAAQLSLAILFQETNHSRFALRNYQDLKDEVIARLPNEEGSTWTLTSTDIDNWRLGRKSASHRKRGRK